MAGVDKKRLSDAFGRNAVGYDVHAEVQKRVITRLTELLREQGTVPRYLLDIGCGTGILLRNLAHLYPEARLVGLDLAFGMCLAAKAGLPENSTIDLVVGDAEALPFRGMAFDLVVSTSTFQWLGNLDRIFQETSRVLAGGGRLVFAMFGERTLYELRSSYRKAWEICRGTDEERTHTFPFLVDVDKALTGAGFIDVNVFSEREIELHRDVPSLLRSLRNIGAGNAAPLRGKGLGEKGVMREMMGVYQREYGAEGSIPATYEVIYGTAAKPSAERST